MAASSKPPVDRAFTRQLPKIELHAHLSGSISRQCLHEVWKQKKEACPDLELEDPLIAIPPGKVDYDLKTFFPVFTGYIYKLCSDIQSIEYTTNAVLKDFEADGVVYLELRTTPRPLPNKGISVERYVETVLSCIDAYNTDATTRLHTKLILSVDRRMTASQAQQVVNLAIQYRSRGVVGIDLAGDPAFGDVRIFAPAFVHAKMEGLKITLHFAEAPSVTDEELSTLLSWNPDRIGHVIHVKDEFKEMIVKQGVGVELCLSCNVHAKMLVGTSGNYSDHHFGEWKHEPVGVALSTDDVGIFCSPLSEEYYLAAEHFGLSKNEIRRLCQSAVQIIFGGEDEKERLRALYRDWDQWTA